MTPVRINLLPRYRLAAYAGAARVRAWSVMLLISLAAGGAFSFAAKSALGRDNRALEAESGALAGKVRAAQSDLANARTDLRQALAREATVRQVLDHPDWAALMGIIARRLGDDVVLRDLRVRPAIAGKAGATGGYRLELKGLSGSQSAVAQFVSALERTLLFDQVRLSRTGREPFGTIAATSFEIECIMSSGGDK
jgi:Tfp pilus assembly protein PilN